MSDLIRRNYLIEVIKDQYKPQDNNSVVNEVVSDILHNIILDAPVAFDVDKVFEKISEKQLAIQEKFYNVADEEYAVMLRGQLRGIADCLEIIKEAQTK